MKEKQKGEVFSEQARTRHLKLQNMMVFLVILGMGKVCIGTMRRRGGGGGGGDTIWMCACVSVCLCVCVPVCLCACVSGV